MRPRPPTWSAPVRGSVLAALVTLLTATGHVAGGAPLVDLSPLAVLVPLLAQVLVAVADRCRGTVALLVVLGSGQVALHSLLLVLTAHGHPGAVPGPAMVAAHTVATLATALTLAHADGAVSGLVAALTRTVPRRAGVVPVAVAPPSRPVPDGDVPLTAALVALVAHARRGPPLGC